VNGLQSDLDMKVRLGPFSTKWRSLFHYLLLLPLWAAFFWGWWFILFHWPRPELIASLRLLAFAGSLCGIVITLWIRHNVAIFKEKGPRLGARQITMTFTSDVLGRPLVLARPGVLRDPYVVVDVEGGKKVYRPGPSEQLNPKGVLATAGSG
jgi:hypothetical protein